MLKTCPAARVDPRLAGLMVKNLPSASPGMVASGLAGVHRPVLPDDLILVCLKPDSLGTVCTGPATPPSLTAPFPAFRISCRMAGLLKQFRDLPVSRLDWTDTDVRSTTQRFLLFVQIPAWILPSLLDWWWHKRTDIENTAGLPESFFHAAMGAEVGLPILLSLLFEINPLMLSVLAGAVAVHTATAVGDVRLAIHEREVKTGEQHTHSFMEVLPFMGFAFACCLHGDATRKLLTGRTEPGDWKLTLKKPRLPIPYLAGILGLIAVGGVLPYANELWRCFKRRGVPKQNTGFYKDSDQQVRNC